MPSEQRVAQVLGVMAMVGVILYFGHTLAVQYLPHLFDAEAAKHRKQVQVAEAQQERVSRGLKPLVVAFELDGQVVAAEDRTITLWGTASPIDVPAGVPLHEVEGVTLDKSTIVLRNADHRSAPVGQGAQGRAYFVERRVVAGRAGQPPLWEWVYDMDPAVALARLRQHAVDPR